MSQPKSDLPISLAPRRRALWPWLLAGLALLLVFGFFLAVRLKLFAHSHERGVVNPSAAISLADFVDRETLRWQTAPRGTQVCDGATFICNGALRTAGLNAARDGKRFPGAVLGVPVNRRGSRIHLLQSAENTLNMVEGAAYARIVLHYANGETRKLELLFGVHGDDWLQSKAHPNEPVADPNSRIAWSQRRTGDGRTVRCYHTMLESSLPEVPIVTMDFISALSEANLLLFGLSVDEDSRLLTPSYEAGEKMVDAPVIDPISLRLQNAAGQAVPGASLGWTALGPRIRIEFPAFPADAQGQITIEVPRGSIRQIEFKASAPDGSSVAGTLQPNTTGVFPPTVAVKLAPGAKP